MASPMSNLGEATKRLKALDEKRTNDKQWKAGQSRQENRRS